MAVKVSVSQELDKGRERDLWVLHESFRKQTGKIIAATREEEEEKAQALLFLKAEIQRGYVVSVFMYLSFEVIRVS